MWVIWIDFCYSEKVIFVGCVVFFWYWIVIVVKGELGMKGFEWVINELFREVMFVLLEVDNVLDVEWYNLCGKKWKVILVNNLVLVK